MQSIPYFQSQEDGKCFLLLQSQAQRVNPNIRPSDSGTRQIPHVHDKCLLYSFSGALIYSAGRVINNSVVLGEIQLPAVRNVSPEVREEKKKAWEIPETCQDLYLLDSYQCHLPVIKVFG